MVGHRPGHAAYDPRALCQSRARLPLRRVLPRLAESTLFSTGAASTTSSSTPTPATPSTFPPGRPSTRAPEMLTAPLESGTRPTRSPPGNPSASTPTCRSTALPAPEHMSPPPVTSATPLLVSLAAGLRQGLRSRTRLPRRSLQPLSLEARTGSPTSFG